MMQARNALGDDTDSVNPEEIDKTEAVTLRLKFGELEFKDKDRYKIEN